MIQTPAKLRSPRFLALSGIVKIMNSVACHGTASASQNAWAWKDGTDAHQVFKTWNQARIDLEDILCEASLWVYSLPCVLAELKQNRCLQIDHNLVVTYRSPHGS